MTRPGRDTAAYKRARAQCRAEEDVCHLCGRPIDKALPMGHPWSFTADHLIPVGWRPDDPRLDDRTYLRAAHWRCNASRGSRPLAPRPSRAW